MEAMGSTSMDLYVMAKLLLCLAPLAMARIVPAIVNHSVFRALTSDDDNVIEMQQLAGFGIAYNVYQLFECSIAAYCTVSQVLVASKKDSSRISISAFLFSGLMIGICAFLAATSIGGISIATLFNVDKHVIAIAQKTLGYISLNILIHALSELHSGIMIQMKLTAPIFVSSLLNLAVQMGISTLCADLARGLVNPLVVPIIAIYAGNFVRLFVIVVWYYARVHVRLPPERPDNIAAVRAGEILEVLVPLGALALARAITVPLARIFMGFHLSAHDTTAQNAVLTLVLPVERLFTSWLNRLKDVYLAFTHDKAILTFERSILFTSLCLVTTVGLMALFCGFHELGDHYFILIFKMNSHVARLCTQCTIVYLYLPFFACLRTHALFWLVRKRHTKIIVPFVFLRLVALPPLDIFLNHMNINGAALGSALCVACHGVEALLLTLVTLFYKYQQQKDEKNTLLVTNIHESVKLAAST